MSAVLLPRLKKQIFFKTYCSCCRGKWVKERMVYLWLLKHFHRNNILLLHSHFMGPGTSYDQVSRWAREINFADRKSLQVTWGVEMCYSSTVQSKTYHIQASFKSHLTYENKYFTGLHSILSKKIFLKYKSFHTNPLCKHLTVVLHHLNNKIKTSVGTINPLLTYFYLLTLPHILDSIF